ncbi:MAG: hypothetical protein R3E01_36510 [Pirellulaceae bacterium]
MRFPVPAMTLFIWLLSGLTAYAAFEVEVDSKVIMIDSTTFRYEYSLTNLSASDRSLGSFAIEFPSFVSLNSLAAPSSFIVIGPSSIVGLPIYDTRVAWTIDDIDMSLGVLPGSSAHFEVVSRAAPGIVEYTAVSMPYEDDNIDIRWGQTIGPSIAVPEPSQEAFLLGCLGFSVILSRTAYLRCERWREIVSK